MKKYVLLKSVLYIIVISQLLISCATFKCGKLADVQTLPDKSKFQNKPVILLDVNFHTFLKGQNTEPVENITAKEQFIPIVEKVTKESNLFNKYTFDKFTKEKIDYTIQIDMLNYGNYWGAVSAGCISGLSLGIIPVYATDNYRLSCKVLDNNGKELKSCQYEDCIKTWFHLFLLPLMGTVKKVPKEVWENMLKTFYQDLINNEVLKYSYYNNPEKWIDYNILCKNY